MYAWITARRIKPGAMEEFKRVWEEWNKEQVAGLRTVYFLQDTRDPDRMIGVAIWDSEDAFDRYASSITEKERTQDMKPYIQDVEWERWFEVTEY